MHPEEALRQIAFLLERNLAETYKVQAFRRAARSISSISIDDLQALAAEGRLRTIAGVGKSTEQVIIEALTGVIPEYLVRVEAEPSLVPVDLSAGVNDIRRALRGDCHTHSVWSDGGSPIGEMARAARDLGHEYIVLTDHSPRLTVANGLSAERLEQQIDEIDQVNDELADECAKGSPVFRILKGIEVDILEDGGLDQTDELLGRLDVVVASVHSDLRADPATMTNRMLEAIANPMTNVLGHCTGRKVMGRQRPPSSFDSAAVFEACVEHDVAVEINCRPERRDPPIELLGKAVAAGCRFAIDTDAHAPGQLSWQPIGCERADRTGVDVSRVVNALTAEELRSWASAGRN